MKTVGQMGSADLSGDGQSITVVGVSGIFHAGEKIAVLDLLGSLATPQYALQFHC